MNHLAHFLLAPHTSAGVIGTLLADFHRGSVTGTLPADVADAVRLHRRIDSATDAHPAVRDVRCEFDASQRRFAGLALDLYFDHCLARDWALHSDTGLDAFVDDVHADLQRGLEADYVPERMRTFAQAMRDGGWLRSYATFDGVERALGRLNNAFRRRFAREVELRPLATELRRLAPQCDAAFSAVFADLRALARR